MNTLRKLKKNAKALSPVVASIILIAVTVAVSIAVAVWMGALTTGFMQTEQLTITSATITGASTANSTIVLGVRNTGTTAVTVDQVWLGTSQIGTANLTLSFGSSLASNAQGTVTISNQTQIVSGGNYVFKLISAKGTTFQYTAIAP